MRRLRFGGLVAVLGLVVLAVWSPLASAKNSHCLVINSARNTSYDNLQAGVDGASDGDTLWVRGTCTGNTTIDTNLTITGQQPHGFTAPTLDGGGNSHVLTVDGVTVTVNDLTITNGAKVYYGGGIYNGGGTVTLNNSSVNGNHANGQGGGISNNGGGTVTLNNSSVNGNTAANPDCPSSCGSDGGIFNGGSGVVILNDSSVNNNTAATSAGGIDSYGEVYLYDSSVDGNTASNDVGGGIYNQSTGTVYLYGSSSVNGNTAEYGYGGGIYNNGGVYLGDQGSVTGNSAYVGGGIYNYLATVYDCTSGAHYPWTGAISPNTPDDTPTLTGGASCTQ